jgi:predicted ATP-grasp superfamily ATP-dependent carboligase
VFDCRNCPLIGFPGLILDRGQEGEVHYRHERLFMKIGGFQLSDPIPECHEPYVLATLRPWIDVNNVGTLVLKEVAARFEAKELGRLSRPGSFYDFTRYRPVIDLEDGIRDLSIPNTTIRYAKREGQNDLLLLRLLEPHAHSELFVASVLKLLKTFKARRYILLGGMYDSVPHTRPLLVSGYGMGGESLRAMGNAGVLPITYHGPSTIANLITKEAAESGIEAIVLIVSVPQYVALEEDHVGKLRLMEILNILCDIPVDQRDFERASEQRDLINERVESSQEARILLPQLESAYDMRIKATGGEGAAELTSEMEEMFWKIMGKDIGKA